MESYTSNNANHETQDEHGSEIPMVLFSSISPVLHQLLTNYNLDARDLASLDASCVYFSQISDHDDNLSWTETAALELCKRSLISFSSMTASQLEHLKNRCGGTWKRVLRFLLAGEFCSRRGKSHVLCGPEHSIVVISRGSVWSFGNNVSGQLGYVTQGLNSLPRRISSLEGIRIVKAAVGDQRTFLVSDAGRVYACGVTSFGEVPMNQNLLRRSFVPTLLECLKNIFVIDVTIGNYFTAILSREGKVYTLSLRDNVIGHHSNSKNIHPSPLGGELEHLPVVQISAGQCYLLALACNSTGMSVYSVGCGCGGKLGHGVISDEEKPKLITKLVTLNLEPVMISAGYLHGVVLGKDGRVCTWGYGINGGLGHGVESSLTFPKVVESLAHLKAVYVTAGIVTTFVVTEDNDVYSLGYGYPSCVGREGNVAGPYEIMDPNTLVPLKIPHLKEILKEPVVQISMTNSNAGLPHTMVLTESNKIYAFGIGPTWQLGVELEQPLNSYSQREKPEQVLINLNEI